MALDISLDKLVTSRTGNLGDAVPVDARVMLARLLKDMGFLSVTIANIAPADTKVLWWHKDAKTAKRYNPLLGNWFAVTADQLALHLLHRVFEAATEEISIEDDDLFTFFDASVGETKAIRADSFVGFLTRGGWTLVEEFTVTDPVPEVVFDVPSRYESLFFRADGVSHDNTADTSIFSSSVIGSDDSVIFSNGENAPASHGATDDMEWVQIIGDNAAAIGGFHYSLGTGSFPWQSSSVDIASFRWAWSQANGPANIDAGTFKMFAR